MAKPEIAELELEIRHAQKLARDGKCLEAFLVVRSIRQALSVARIESAFLCWLAAVTADGLGMIAEAVDLIDRACAADPACPSFLNSRRIIYQRAGNAITPAAASASAN
jgi:hypothetical protein